MVVVVITDVFVVVFSFFLKKKYLIRIKVRVRVIIWNKYKWEEFFVVVVFKLVLSWKIRNAQHITSFFF